MSAKEENLHVHTLFDIENFRAVQSVQLKTDKRLNVIVGPNATGKTTILESIRLAKALLAPRYMQESQQALQSMSALAQHVQQLGDQVFDYSALANDPNRPIKITVRMTLSASDIATIRSSGRGLGLALVQSRLARNEDTLGLTQYLSSKEGAAALQSAEQEMVQEVARYSAGSMVELRLQMQPGSLTLSGGDFLSQTIVATIDRSIPPAKSLFSYFPADRSFPPGETQLQLGSADMQQQIFSHIGQPTLKYGRLKSFVAQSVISGAMGQSSLQSDFASIFQNLLPGKSFIGVNINAIGLLKVLVQDDRSGKVFDIDSLSSGEKGLILTFLLARSSVVEGGVLLLDEPELHLNPAVTRRIIKYLLAECCERSDIQIFTCTHSPEILADAFESDACSLFHLRSGTDLSPVYRSDTEEIFEILRRLGASTGDILFSKGSLFVEGVDDEELLPEGFPDVLGGWKVKELGGRAEIEKSIGALQGAVASGENVKPTIFILDRDRERGKLRSVKPVAVLQWDRYAFENYLLDEKVLYDVVYDNATIKPESRGSFSTALRELALQQVEGLAIALTYSGLEPDNAGVRPREIKGKTIEEASAVLADRLTSIKVQLTGFDSAQWVTKFVASAKVKAEELRGEWISSWKSEVDGKKLIDSLYEVHQISLSKKVFKRKVLARMRDENTETWRAVQSLLQQAVRDAGS